MAVRVGCADPRVPLDMLPGSLLVEQLESTLKRRHGAMTPHAVERYRGDLQHAHAATSRLGRLVLAPEPVGDQTAVEAGTVCVESGAARTRPLRPRLGATSERAAASPSHPELPGAPQGDVGVGHYLKAGT